MSKFWVRIRLQQMERVQPGFINFEVRGLRNDRQKFNQVAKVKDTDSPATVLEKVERAIRELDRWLEER